jgi:hypothetical protein
MKRRAQASQQTPPRAGAATAAPAFALCLAGVGRAEYLWSLTCCESTEVSATGLAVLEALPCWTMVRLYDRGFDEDPWRAFQERRAARINTLEAASAVGSRSLPEQLPPPQPPGHRPADQVDPVPRWNASGRG